MTVGRGAPIDRPAQIEVADDRRRAEIEQISFTAFSDAEIGSTTSVPKVSTMIEIGRATPIA